MPTVYSFNIQFPAPSYGGMMGGTIEERGKALFDFGAHVAYYAHHGHAFEKLEFVEFCQLCQGKGKVRVCHPRNKMAHSHKPSCYRVCPDCKGHNSEKLIDGLPSDAMTGYNAQTPQMSAECNLISWYDWQHKNNMIQKGDSMVITNQDNNFVVYAHKTNRHNWNMYGHWLTLEEGLFDLDQLTEQYSKYWPAGEFALVKITFAENDNHEILDNIRHLPGAMLRTRLAIDTQGG